MSEANIYEPVYQIKFGSVEPKIFYYEEYGRLISYTYSIHRDRYGNETHRTTPIPISSIGYGDSSPFTLEECKRLLNGGPRRR